jgi:AraC family transcriptional regulator
MMEADHMSTQAVGALDTKPHLGLHLRQRLTPQASAERVADYGQLSDKSDRAAAGSADGRSGLRLVTWANQQKLDPAATLFGAVSGGFRGVQFRPARFAKRQTAAWRGLSGEVVRIVSQDPFESDYHGPCHLLILYTQAARHRGESVVEDLPRSTLHDLSGKLTFVPAGRRFRELQEPRVFMRATYLYIDPRSPLVEREAAFAETELAPRLFFDDPVLRQTALKLEALIESGPSGSRLYAEALGSVLAHELLRLNSGTVQAEPLMRGGLAGWQRRLVAQYIEDNMREQISLAELAELAQLSVFHFSRAFKQSFGMPPHRYHTSQRIERAKILLAKPNQSVTEIALDMGFSDTSSFTATFRKSAGRTPTEYRRSVV